MPPRRRTKKRRGASRSKVKFTSWKKPKKTTRRKKR
jgi:hypothetical protein